MCPLVISEVAHFCPHGSGTASLSRVSNPSPAEFPEQRIIHEATDDLWGNSQNPAEWEQNQGLEGNLWKEETDTKQGCV